MLAGSIRQLPNPSLPRVPFLGFCPQRDERLLHPLPGPVYLHTPERGWCGLRPLRDSIGKSSLLLRAGRGVTPPQPAAGGHTSGVLAPQTHPASFGTQTVGWCCHSSAPPSPRPEKGGGRLKCPGDRPWHHPRPGTAGNGVAQEEGGPLPHLHPTFPSLEHKGAVLPQSLTRHQTYLPLKRPRRPLSSQHLAREAASPFSQLCLPPDLAVGLRAFPPGEVLSPNSACR